MICDLGDPMSLGRPVWYAHTLDAFDFVTTDHKCTVNSTGSVYVSFSFSPSLSVYVSFSFSQDLCMSLSLSHRSCTEEKETLPRSLRQERSWKCDVSYSMRYFFDFFGFWHHRQKLYGACGRSDFGCLKRQQRAGWLCFQTLSRYSRHTHTPTHKIVHIHSHTYTLERSTLRWSTHFPYTP